MNDYEKALRKSNLFSGMIYSSCRMSAWGIGFNSLKIYYSTCPYEQDFFMFFTMSGCLEYVRSEERDFHKPVYLSDSIGLIWAADYIWNGDNPEVIIVIGPVFSSESSVRGLLDSLRAMPFSMPVRNSLAQKLKTVPIISLDMMEQYISMMHYALTEEMVQKWDFQYQNIEATSHIYDGEQEIVHTDRANTERLHTLEHTMLQVVRDGNRNYKQILGEQGNFASPKDYGSSISNRDDKNSLIILIALCARAAMEGGLPQQTAADLEQKYIALTEKAKNISQLISLRNQMMEDFIGRVHQCKTHPEVSKPIQECCDFIQRNLLKPIELGDIARAVGYTEYYLTKKFNKEMGVRLLDYIKDARIEMAKVWLLTTSKSIQEISDQMYFGTRNYFSKVFREKVGVTPAAYRERLQAVQDGGLDNNEDAF